MSAYHERKYKAKQRQKIAEDRVRQTTKAYYKHYQLIMTDIQSQDLVDYVASDYAALNKQLTHMNTLLHSDPFAAREISLTIGQSIHALPHTARHLRNTMQANERHAAIELEQQKIVQEKQKKSKMETLWQQELASWEDKLSLNLVLKELSQLHASLIVNTISTTENKIKQQLDTLKTIAQQKALDYRAQLNNQSLNKANLERIEQLKSDITAATLSTDKVKSLSEQLESINKSAKTQSEIEQIISQTEKAADQAMEDESIRRSVVKAVYTSLNKAGFSVNKPVHIQEKDKDEVIISASRPAGNQVKFEIELDGTLRYKFDHYKGQSCQKDIKELLPKLSKIYGVDLSDTRVLWHNPDDEDAQLKPIPKQTSQNA